MLNKILDHLEEWLISALIAGATLLIFRKLYEPLPVSQRGKLISLGADMDETYKVRLRTLVLRPDMVATAPDLKIVFTSIHGTGGIISVPVLRELGFKVLTVPEQDPPDGAFPTVTSPNPENADALAMAIALAEKEGKWTGEVLGTGSVMSDYVFVTVILPLKPGDEDYAISCVVPIFQKGFRRFRSYQGPSHDWLALSGPDRAGCHLTPFGAKRTPASVAVQKSASFLQRVRNADF